MIAIATPDTDTPAETYVRQHIRLIDPENTAVIYFKGEGNFVSHIPSLKILNDHSILGKFRSLYNFVFNGYSGVVNGQSKADLEQFIRKNNIKAIHAEFGPIGCALAPICKSMQVNLVVNFHGFDATVMPQRWEIRRAYRFLEKKVNHFVCGSNHFAQRLVDLGFSKNKIHVVPCGIELSEFEIDKEKDVNLVVAVGRLVSKKAPDLSIRAFIKCLNKFPDLRLEIIGEGPARKKCEQLINKYKLEDKIILHGAKPHDFVKSLLAKANLFIQHSLTAENGDTESQGISLLEAMASKIAVVTTDHNGFSETVIDGKTGYLVPERDVNLMAQKMLYLIDNQERAKTFGIAGRDQVIERFNADTLSVKLNQILKARD